MITVTTESARGKMDYRRAARSAYITTDRDAGGRSNQIAVDAKGLINISFLDGLMWSGTFEELKSKVI